MPRKRTKTELLRVGGPNRVREALEAARNNVPEAARALGVDRSTLHRWIVADPSMNPALRDVPAELTPGTNLEPDQWEQWVRATYNLTATEEALLDLARRALTIARDADARPADQLAAMGRFQRLVIQLDLERPIGQAQATERPRLTVVR